MEFGVGLTGGACVVWGVLSYLLLRTLTGKARHIPAALWATGGLALATVIAEQL